MSCFKLLTLIRKLVHDWSNFRLHLLMAISAVFNILWISLFYSIWYKWLLNILVRFWYNKMIFKTGFIIMWNIYKHVKYVNASISFIFCNRLSRIASQQLIQGNPNITDLSDGNRPTKLGERFSQVYDDQWSEAFEALKVKGKQEKEIVTKLSDNVQVTVLSIYNFYIHAIILVERVQTVLF